jgi:hypothetical protein
VNSAPSIQDNIQQRFSCRTFLAKAIAEPVQQSLKKQMAQLQVGPLGTRLRFHLITATEEDGAALKGLGTYGFIKGASGFLVGAVESAEKDMEDYGYAMERLVLAATELGLSSCWLGGSFTQSRFAAKINAAENEQLPAVVAVGYMADPVKARDTLVRRQLGAKKRLPWEKLFFDQAFGALLTREQAGAYATALDMVRLGPSASNKQPWRIIRDGNVRHFYLQRTQGYRDGLFSRLMRIGDLQRLDMGIAMCHFELAADELGLRGRWIVQEPAITKPDALTEYAASWSGEGS